MKNSLDEFNSKLDMAEKKESGKLPSDQQM